jgi:hypothetical protein
MARWLVWTCGGVLAVGILALLFAASASNKEDQVRTAPAARPAPSTPASTNQEALFRFEVQLQQKLMKDGYLVPPGPNASPTEVKAYTYILESKAAGENDAQALRAAAKRILDEKEQEHALRREEHHRASQERKALDQQKAAERRAVLPPDAAVRFQSVPKPVLAVDTEPVFVEDPANPLPKPPAKP